MKKYFLLGIAFVFAFSFFMGCGGNEEGAADLEQGELQEPEEAPKEQEGLTKKKADVPQELERMINHFRNAGFEIGAYSEKRFDMLGASSGLGVELDGHEVELYYFDPKKTDQETLDGLNDLHNPEASIAVVINGYYQLIVGLHPKQEKIIETFMNF